MTDDVAKTEIELIIGFDRTTPPIKMIRDAGLAHRTGVIQHTCRPDCVDAFFDKLLWRRLLEFAEAVGVVSIIDRPRGGPEAPNRDWQSGKATQPTTADERPLVDFLERWDGDDPPEFVLARSGGDLVLSIATEYWTQVGGPRPYADSYTYFICSREPLSERVYDSLRTSPASANWSLSPNVLNANE